MRKSKQEINRSRCEQHVSEWLTSGMTQADYCRQHVLNAKLFSAWVNRVRKGSSELGRLPLTIVPLKITQEQEDASITLNTTSLMLQHKSGWHLILPSEVQTVWLGNLLSQIQ